MAPRRQAPLRSSLLDKRQATNVVDILNELPAFRASTTLASTNLTANVGADFANLRSRRTYRTLVLVDGLRHVPSGGLGQVDLHFIPTLLVERAEVVTGGASSTVRTPSSASSISSCTANTKARMHASTTGITEQGNGREYRGAFVGAPHSVMAVAMPRRRSNTIIVMAPMTRTHANGGVISTAWSPTQPGRCRPALSRRTSTTPRRRRMTSYIMLMMCRNQTARQPHF